MATKEGTGARLKTEATIKPWVGHKIYDYRVSYVEGGRYKQKGFKLKKDAKKWIKDREGDVGKFGNDASLTVSERSSVLDNRSKLEELGLTLGDAVAFAIDYHEKRRVSISVRETFDLFMDAKRKKRNKRGEPLTKGYIDELERRVGRFVAIHGDEPISTIDSDMIEEWIDSLYEDYDPLGVKHHRDNLGQMFNFATKKKKIPENPFLSIDTVETVRKKPGILTPEKLSELLENAPTQIVPYLVISAFSGARDAELKRMTWEDVDFSEGIISLSEEITKSSHFRDVDMSDNLVKWLSRFVPSKGSMSEPIWPTNGRKLLDQARQNAGFANPERLSKEVREKRDDWQRWPHNALRHSFASYHFAKHKNFRLLMNAMGHAESTVTLDHYRTRVKKKAQAETYWNIAPDQADNIVSMAG